jgi:hypothetical protein
MFSNPKKRGIDDGPFSSPKRCRRDPIADLPARERSSSRPATSTMTGKSNTRVTLSEATVVNNAPTTEQALASSHSVAGPSHTERIGSISMFSNAQGFKVGDIHVHSTQHVQVAQGNRIDGMSTCVPGFLSDGLTTLWSGIDRLEDAVEKHSLECSP